MPESVMAERLRVLFVDDDPSDVLLARYELQREGLACTCRTVCNESDLRRELTRFHPDVVLCDYTIPGFSGPGALAITRSLQPTLPVLMISGSIAEDTAVECLKSGATDYLLKSSLRRLGPAVRRAIADARQRQEFEARIEKLAHYDSLTGLPNLAQVAERMNHVIMRAREAHRMAGLVILDLDRFRFVDESFGRHIADEALKGIGELLKMESRARDTVARIGPDEFLLVLSDLEDSKHAGALVQSLLASIAATRTLAGRELRLSASAGIALYPNDGADFETLLHKATEAMHEAKATSLGGMQFHSGEVVRLAQQRRRLETGLRNAIQHNELTLHFQPQFEIRTGRVCGVEALTRWFRADGEVISPSVFIPLAEQSGSIGELGAWALRASCKTVMEWTEFGKRLPTVCVNVSTQQIGAEFTHVIAETLESTGLPPDRLELEITESVLLGNTDATLASLAQWKRLGVRIAVDDFGTGYSSLGYLSRLPVDRLKMDKSLIHGMTLQSKESAIVRAVISLGRELGFTVLAEGVETEEQLTMLDALGCQQVQGYLLAAPTCAAETRLLMESRWGARSAGRAFRPRAWAASTRDNAANGRHCR
jgi:diguanylate cyclase (GGDEF)-like protein